MQQLEKGIICDDPNCSHQISLLENPLLPLECGHSVCLNFVKACLQDSEEKDNKFAYIQCPVCQTMGDVNIQFFLEFHKYFKVQNVIKYEQNADQKFLCSKDNEPIQFYCSLEQLYLCQKCVSGHFSHAPGNLDQCDLLSIKNEFNQIYQQLNSNKLIESFNQLHSILVLNQSKNSNELSNLKKNLKINIQDSKNDQQSQNQNNMKEKEEEKVSSENPENQGIKSKENNIQEINQLERHENFKCDTCQMNPIIGTRFKCLVCDDFDMCQGCMDKKLHQHPVYKIQYPIDKHYQIRSIFHKFLASLKSDLKEQNTIEENGLFHLKNSAKNISQNPNYIETQKKDVFLENEFKKEFEAAQKTQNDQSRQAYFYSILNTFKIFNPNIPNLSNVTNPILDFKKKYSIQDISEEDIQILINPKNSDVDVVQRQKSLEKIGLKQIDWQGIITKIIDLVTDTLSVKLDQDKLKEMDEKQVFFIKIIGQQEKFLKDQLDQIKQVQNQKVKKEIIEVLNSEFIKKMGLIMSKQMEIKITFCAIIIFWIQVCKQSELAITILHEKNKDKYFQEFKQLSIQN